MGAAADSGHEYLLKQFLLTDKTDMANLEMCTSPLCVCVVPPALTSTQTS